MPIKACPFNQCETIGYISRNEEFDAIARNDRGSFPWYKIAHGGDELGWVSVDSRIIVSDNLWDRLPEYIPTTIMTPKPTPTSFPITMEVTFDGNECTASGSTELPIGEHSFVLKDLSGQKQVLYVDPLLDDHTFQDLLDEQSEPGVWWPKPNWVVHTRKLGPEWNESVGAQVYCK